MGEPDSEQLDGDLVVAALAGSQQAYAGLLKRYERPVFSIVVRIVRDRAEAEEVAQEAFLKAFRNLESYDQGRKFSSWLFKIAHNSAIDLLRRRRLQTVPIETPGEDDRDLLARIADEAAEDP